MKIYIYYEQQRDDQSGINSVAKQSNSDINRPEDAEKLINDIINEAANKTEKNRQEFIKLAKDQWKLAKYKVTEAWRNQGKKGLGLALLDAIKALLVLMKTFFGGKYESVITALKDKFPVLAKINLEIDGGNAELRKNDSVEVDQGTPGTPGTGGKPREGREKPTVSPPGTPGGIPTPPPFPKPVIQAVSPRTGDAKPPVKPPVSPRTGDAKPPVKPPVSPTAPKLTEKPPRSTLRETEKGKPTAAPRPAARPGTEKQAGANAEKGKPIAAPRTDKQAGANAEKQAGANAARPAARPGAEKQAGANAEKQAARPAAAAPPTEQEKVKNELESRAPKIATLIGNFPDGKNSIVKQRFRQTLTKGTENKQSAQGREISRDMDRIPAQRKETLEEVDRTHRKAKMRKASAEQLNKQPFNQRGGKGNG